jgi:hypothetical protein
VIRRILAENAGLRAENGRLRGDGDPHRYVFVITYGRSGSTLLQGILNSIPGYLVRGENGQVLHDLWRFDMTATEHAQKMRRPAHRKGVESLPPQDAWFGMDLYRPRVARRHLRALFVDEVIQPPADAAVIGFKEVRWDLPDLPDFVAWIQEIFPGARFIINTRNLVDVAQSGWWAGHENPTPYLADLERRILDVAQTLGDAAFHVHYDDYVGDPTALRPLFAWLGEPFDETRVRTVMATPHSYAPRAERGTTAP